MATRKILEFGRDDMLRKHSRVVEKFDKRLWTLLDDMADTMYEADGAGLAAVQVGVLKRCVVIDVASDPGGVDHAAADALGIQVIWARGLPGRVAPATAAQVIRDAIYHILEERGEPI